MTTIWFPSTGISSMWPIRTDSIGLLQCNRPRRVAMATPIHLPPPPPTSLPRVLWRIITVSFFTSFLPSFLSFFLPSVRVSIFFRWLPSCIQSRNRESLRRDRRGSAPTNEGIGDAELFVRMRRIKRPIRTRRGVCLSTVNSDLTPS